MQTKPVRIGTRGSKLAVAQAEETRARLMQAHNLQQHNFEIVVISTEGDRIQDRALSEVGGKGLFTEDIESRLLDGSIDIAAHSSKDMPNELPQNLVLSTFLPREDVRDAFISNKYKSLDDMPIGSVLGTSSLRRQAIVKSLRPDLKIVIYRGNVQTRLRKLEEGVADATLLACAGLRRLNNDHLITNALEIEQFLPAVGQGAICLEVNENNAPILKLLTAINDQVTMDELTLERAFLGDLDGSCRTPIAGLARVEGNEISFRGQILLPDGTENHFVTIRGSRADVVKLGKDAASQLKEIAGPEFLEKLAQQMV